MSKWTTSRLVPGWSVWIVSVVWQAIFMCNLIKEDIISVSVVLHMHRFDDHLEVFLHVLRILNIATLECFLCLWDNVAIMQLHYTVTTVFVYGNAFQHSSWISKASEGNTWTIRFMLHMNYDERSSLLEDRGRFWLAAIDLTSVCAGTELARN